MPLVFTQGDLLDWPTGITVLVHGANSRGLHGAGLAKQIADRYPDAAAEYREWCEGGLGGRAHLGTFYVSHVDDGAHRVVWLVSQRDVGTDRRQVDYEAVYTGLAVLNQTLISAQTEGRDYVLGMPAWIGCGLAGGAAPVIEAMVKHIYAKSAVKCVVVQQSGGRR